MTTACVYTRISFDDDLTGLGVARQEEDCRSLAARKGWDVGQVFTDNNVSAWKRGTVRPQYQEMMQALRAGKFDALVVYHSSRLYRQPVELEDLILLCENGTIQFAKCDGEIDLATPAGRTIARILVAIDNQASADTSTRVKRKNVERAAAGFLHHHAYGITTMYMTKPDGKQIVTGYTLNEHQAGIIREIAANVIKGKTVRSQCIMLNARGEPSPGGKVWLGTGVRKLLSSPIMIGERGHNGSTTKGAFPAILTRAEQATIMARFSHRNSVGRPPAHLLSGILRAGCGKGMMYQGPTGKIKARYSCPSRPQGDGCTSIVADKSEEWVIAQVLAHSDTRPTKIEWSDDGGLADLIAADETILRDLDAGVVAGTVSLRQAGTLGIAIEARVSENKTKLEARGPSGNQAGVGYDFLRETWDEVGENIEYRREVITGLVDHIDVGEGLDAIWTDRMKIVWR